MRQTSDNSRYQHQRTEAIKAAAAVFSEKGFHGSSTKDIAERMGIKQGSLYYYFKSKEEALGEVCLLGLEDYVERMEKIANAEQPFEAKLMATLTSHLDERLYLPADKRTPLKELGSHYRQLLEGIFEEGIRQGAIRNSIDCHFAALAVIGICNAWGELIVRDDDLDTFDIIQKCTDLLLQGLSERRKVDRTTGQPIRADA
jgi:AcrR family transcriptional regulator